MIDPDLIDNPDEYWSWLIEWMSTWEPVEENELPDPDPIF